MPHIIYNRPDCIKKYEKQCQFIDCESRFTIVEATTKAGKTLGCIVWLFEQALLGKEGDNCWWVAPTFAVSKIAYRRMKRYIQPRSLYVESKSELTLTLINGATIFFKGADNPDSLYGEDVIAAVLDEATRMKEDAWTAVFSTLTATDGKCKIIGNVKGTNNWAYQLAREAETGKKPNWSYFKITASDAVDAGILKQSTIDEAKRTLPNGVFLELYYGIPNVNASDKFCFSFSKEKHVKRCVHDPGIITYLSWDFNVNPCTCLVIQSDMRKTINVIEVIQLENSNVERVCDVINVKYPNAFFRVTGDASGKNRSAINVDNLNAFDIISKKLKVNRARMDIIKSNALLEDSQMLVNAIFEHWDVAIDPQNSERLIFDCEFASVDGYGKLKKTDRKDEAQKLDALDAFRYWLQAYLQSKFKKLI